MKNVWALLILSILLSGCSNPEPADFPTGVLKFDETAQDIQVEVNENKETPNESPKGRLDSAELFEHLYFLQALGERTRHSYWARDSQTHLIHFYENPNTHTEVKFADSPYAEVFTAASQAEYMAATDNLKTFFFLEWKKLNLVLLKLMQDTPEPQGAMSLSQAMQVIVNLMNQFESLLLKSNVDPAIQNALLSGVYEEFWLKLPATKSIVMELEASADFEAAIETLKGLIATMDIELTADEQGHIESASQIGPMLNRERLKPKHIFNILVRLWDLMGPEERTETFGEISPELYDYLSDKSQRSIECLKKRDCRSLVDSLAEKWVIVPEIKKYGVEKLRSEIEASAVVGIKEMTAAMATEFIQDVPVYLAEAIEKRMLEERDRLLAIRGDYISYVKKEMQSWYSSEFQRNTLPAMERKNIVLTDNFRFYAETNQSSFFASADTMGSAMLASAQLFRKVRTPLAKTQPKKIQILGLTRLGQLLAHSGFDMADGSAFPSLSRAFYSGSPFNLEAGFEFPSLFAMSPTIQLNKGFETIRPLAPNDWNVISQARLLMGFAHKMDNFKDWETGTLDESIGRIQAKELLPGIPSDELETSAFPEDAFLAVSFGNAAAILNNLKTTGSPAFVMCQQGEILWADSDEECKKASALAGIVNIRDGKKEKHVDLMSQAKFLEAVLEFLKRADVVAQKTRSEYLMEVRGSSSAIEDYNDAQPELKNLAMAMTNFIISKFQSREGYLNDRFELEQNQATGQANFHTHLQVTRALLASADYFHIGPYKRAAVRSYYGLNNKFYNPTNQFYKTGNASVSSMDIAKTLETLERLAPLISNNDSRNQLESLLEAWRNSLRPKSI